jgi:hypothetical protein
MSHYKALLLVAFGGVLGWMIAIALPPRPVRAQDRLADFGGCTSVVPKSWGEFKGGSDFGLAFQDDSGRVRFLQHPTCTDLASPASIARPPIDLQIERQ